MHIVENIKYVDRDKFSGLVDGNYCEVKVTANFIEDVKHGWFTETESRIIITDELIKYYLDNIKDIRKNKLSRL